jgi:hypothetical protein
MRIPREQKLNRINEDSLRAPSPNGVAGRCF